MNFYKKISNIITNQDRENLINEMTDRFGKIPQEVYNLFAVAQIKNSCQKLGIESLEVGNNGIVIAFKNNNFSNANSNLANALLDMVLKSKNEIKITSQQKLHFNFKISESSEDRINKSQEIIAKLIKLYEQ
jgi:transcription-repair coupling factor (superfamily II helicase)